MINRLFVRLFCHAFSQLRHLVVKVHNIAFLLQPSDSAQVLFQDAKEPLFHPLTLGLLYRDPPEQSSSEIRLEIDARDRAKKGLEKAWSDSPEQVIEAERKLLSEQYSNSVAEGIHKNRVNLISGLIEPYMITDLPSKGDMAKENTFLSNEKTFHAPGVCRDEIR